MSTTKPKQPKRLWLVFLSILVMLLLAVFIIGQFTHVVTAFLLKQPINAYSFNPPTNFETIEEKVTAHKDIPYNEKGTLLDSNSAGSHITGQTALLITNPEFADQMGIQPSITGNQLKGALLYDGFYDIRTVRDLHSSVIELYLWSYTGIRNLESFDRVKELSIPDHITPDFPPAFITVGDADRLEPQFIGLIQALERNGVATDTHLFTGTNAHLAHDFMMDLQTQPAQQIMEKALKFLKRYSSSS